jgi:plasminogen activator inhibitor 1 RNA-binding protein
MGSKNQFDLLGEVESDDLSHLAAAAAKKAAALSKPATAAPKLPSKPLPPAQAGKVFTVSVKIRLEGWRGSLY